MNRTSKFHLTQSRSFCCGADMSVRLGSVVFASFATATNRAYNNQHRVLVVVVGVAEDGATVDLVDENGDEFRRAAMNNVRVAHGLSPDQVYTWSTIYENFTGYAAPQHPPQPSGREQRATNRVTPEAAAAARAAGNAADAAAVAGRADSSPDLSHTQLPLLSPPQPCSPHFFPPSFALHRQLVAPRHHPPP